MSIILNICCASSEIINKGKVPFARQQLQKFIIALDQYYLDNGTYPTTEQGLNALIKKPAAPPVPVNYSHYGYLSNKKIPLDPWNNEFIYVSPGTEGNKFEITSYGADGKKGGEGYDADLIVNE